MPIVENYYMGILKKCISQARFHFPQWGSLNARNCFEANPHFMTDLHSDESSAIHNQVRFFSTSKTFYFKVSPFLALLYCYYMSIDLWLQLGLVLYLHSVAAKWLNIYCVKQSLNNTLIITNHPILVNLIPFPI